MHSKWCNLVADFVANFYYQSIWWPMSANNSFLSSLMFLSDIATFTLPCEIIHVKKLSGFIKLPTFKPATGFIYGRRGTKTLLSGVRDIFREANIICEIKSRLPSKPLRVTAERRAFHFPLSTPPDRGDGLPICTRPSTLLILSNNVERRFWKCQTYPGPRTCECAIDPAPK